MSEPERIVYHTFMSEFSGSTAEEVIQQIYRDFKAGTGYDFQQWWNYQREFCADIGQVTAPDHPNVANASQLMLDALVEAGGLENGPIQTRRDIGGQGTQERTR